MWDAPKLASFPGLHTTPGESLEQYCGITFHAITNTMYYNYCTSSNLYLNCNYITSETEFRSTLSEWPYLQGYTAPTCIHALTTHLLPKL